MHIDQPGSYPFGTASQPRTARLRPAGPVGLYPTLWVPAGDRRRIRWGLTAPQTLTAAAAVALAAGVAVMWGQA